MRAASASDHVPPFPRSVDLSGTIDPTAETLVRLTDVPKLGWIPRRSDGKTIHANTIWRWHYRGIRGVHLQTICIGGARVTSIEALRCFFGRVASGERAGVLPSISRQTQVSAANHRVRAILGLHRLESAGKKRGA